MAVLVALLAAVGSTAYAADEPARATRPAPAMREAVYRRLSEAQEHIAKKDYEGALAALAKLRKAADLSPYETAQLWNTYGYLYFTVQRYAQAIDAYRRVLAQPGLPEALERSARYTLAQLQFVTEDYADAATTMEQWLASAAEPPDQAWLLLAQAYYQLKRFEDALRPLEVLERRAAASSEPPPETALLLERVVYFELDRRDALERVLKRLARHYPKAEYWRTLAGVYAEAGRRRRQLVVMELLYEAGALSREADLINLANLYLIDGTPYKAARLLDRELEAGRVGADARRWRLLAQAWLQAREPERAIGPLRRAADAAGDGQPALELAHAYASLERWGEAVGAARRALAKGGLRRPGAARVLLGVALFNAGRLDEARSAFAEAARDAAVRKTARQWLAYVAAEQARRAQLEQALGTAGGA